MMKFRTFSLRFLVATVTLIAVGLVMIPIVIQQYMWGSTKQQLRSYANSDYLKYGYPETMAEARPVFESLIAELIKLGPYATKKQKYNLLQNCTYDLYHLEENVETVEREVFYDATWGIASRVGIGATPEEALEFEHNLMIWRD